MRVVPVAENIKGMGGIDGMKGGERTVKCKVTCPYCGESIVFTNIPGGQSLADCDTCGKTFVVVAPSGPPVAEGQGFKIEGYNRD
jgi:ribosomal protein S27E